MAKKDAIATKQDAPLVTNSIPEYLRKPEGQPRAGLENMERDDMKMPRLALCQSMSPQRKKMDPKYIEGLEEGQYFNTITGKNFTDRLKFIPLLFFKSRIRFTPLDEGGGMLCRSADAKEGVGDPGGVCARCHFSLFSKNTKTNKMQRPACDLFHNYVVLVLEQDKYPTPESMVVLSLKSTGLDAARDLNALMNMRGTDSFAGIYELSSATDTNNANQEYYVPVVKNAGWVDERAYEIAKAAYNVVREVKIDVDFSDVTDQQTTREPGEDEV